MYLRMFRWNPETRCKCHDHENENLLWYVASSGRVIDCCLSSGGAGGQSVPLLSRDSGQADFMATTSRCGPRTKRAISLGRWSAGFSSTTPRPPDTRRCTTTLSSSFSRNTPDSIAPAKGSLCGRHDVENMSPTTKLRFDEVFYRDAPTVAGIVTSDQAPQFNSIAAQLLLANDQASINQFSATLTHFWGRNWASEIALHQTTFWNNGGSNNVQNNTSYEQSVNTFTEYHFSDRFSLGAGYRFYDFRFTFPGRPGEQAHWPFAKIAWRPLANALSLWNCGRSSFLYPGKQPAGRQCGRLGSGRVRSGAVAL